MTKQNDRKGDAWAEMKTFVDPEGRRIAEFTIMDGTDAGKKLYKGTCQLKVKVSPDPSVPEKRMPFEFDFPDDKDFQWVKAHFDETADSAIKEWKEQQEKAQAMAALKARKQIVGAKAMPPGLLGPNGKLVR